MNRETALSVTAGQVSPSQADSRTLKGKRDRAILALLIGCGLRRAELLSLTVESVHLREARCVIPDLLGKGNRIRTVTVPAGVNARIDLWTQAAGITAGHLFRPVTRAGVVKEDVILDEGGLVPGGPLCPRDRAR